MPEALKLSLLAPGSALLAALLAASGNASAAACPKAGALPRVSLTVNQGRIVYDTHKDRRQIAALQGRHGGASRNRGWRPIGLTLTEITFRMKITVNARPRRGGVHCATVGEVEADLGYGDITVYVDRRYRKGSCQYRSVLEHENEHVAIFRDTLALYAPRVEKRLARAAEGLKPVSASTPDRAANRLQKALQRQVDPLFKEMNRVLDSKNNAIDSAKNYKREQARCSSW